MLFHNDYYEEDTEAIAGKGVPVREDLSHPDEIKKVYADYFSRMRVSHTYEDMRKDFARDIEILRDVLLHAFIRAINMEKSFIAREVKIIEDMISWIENDVEFDEFISSNFKFIKAEEFRRLDYAEAERNLKAAVVKEINKVIVEINSAQ